MNLESTWQKIQASPKFSPTEQVFSYFHEQIRVSVHSSVLTKFFILLGMYNFAQKVFSLASPLSLNF